MTQALLVVGEDNPHSLDPSMALYHLPRGASGNRLRRIMGLDDAEYSRLTKRNLCPVGPWRWPAAREERDRILAEGWPGIILLGSKVRRVFGGPAPFELAELGGARVLGLPHPSGLNHIWNDPHSVPTARRALQAAFPGVPWRPWPPYPRPDR